MVRIIIQLIKQQQNVKRKDWYYVQNEFWWKSDSNPDRSVCSAGWTSDSNVRIYPMKYTTGGCGSKGVNTAGGGKGSAHCCEYIDEDPNGATVPGAGGVYTTSITDT